MLERIKNEKIQPYCEECRREAIYIEAMQNYTINKDSYIKKHKKLVRRAYQENVIMFTIKLLLVFYAPIFIVSVFLEEFITDSINFKIFFPIFLAFIVFLISSFKFKEPATIFGKPTPETIAENLKYENGVNEKEVLRLKERLKKEYEYRSTAIDEVDNMSGIEFENFIAELLRKNSYENVNVTKQSGDGGVDITAINTEGEKIAIQCKRVKSKVGNKAIQEIFLGKKIYKCKKGMVITNSFFTKPAYEAALKTGIVLWNRNKLIEELKKLEPKFTWGEFLKSYYILPEGKERIS